MPSAITLYKTKWRVKGTPRKELLGQRFFRASLLHLYATLTGSPQIPRSNLLSPPHPRQSGAFALVLSRAAICSGQ